MKYEMGIKRGRWGRCGSMVPYLLCAGVLLSLSGFAQAQAFEQLSTTMNDIVTLLQGAGVAVVTVAIVWAGYKMIFQHARWSDVATVVLGAVLIGAAATIAKWLIPALS